jgi:hypothetical protein
MFTKLVKFFGVFAVLALVASNAYATGGNTTGTGSEVPEIGPGALISVFTLAAGGVLMLTDKIRRK